MLTRWRLTSRWSERPVWPFASTPLATFLHHNAPFWPVYTGRPLSYFVMQLLLAAEMIPRKPRLYYGLALIVSLAGVGIPIFAANRWFLAFNHAYDEHIFANFLWYALPSPMALLLLATTLCIIPLKYKAARLTISTFAIPASLCAMHLNKYIAHDFSHAIACGCSGYEARVAIGYTLTLIFMLLALLPPKPSPAA